MSNNTLPPLPSPGVRDLSGQFYVGWSREQVEQIRRETVQACAEIARIGIDQAKEDELMTKGRELAGKPGEREALSFWLTVSAHNAALKNAAAAIIALLPVKDQS